MIENSNISSDSTVNEKCVLCNVETDVDIRTHIHFRNYYVEGCGHLCKECFEKTYGD